MDTLYPYAMEIFQTIFLATLLTGLGIQFWLTARQQHHVRQHQGSVPKAFKARITLEEHQKAARYTLDKLKIGTLELLLGTLLLLGWTLGGGISHLNELWVGTGIDPLLMGLCLIFSFTMISALIDLPFSLWRTFVLEEKHGFNRTTLKRYILDMILQSLLGIVIGAPLLWVVLWLMASSGAYWWLYAWAVWMGFMLLMTWAYPTLIAPLFNKFNPLEEGELKTRIQSLLDRCGFASKGIFIMDGSKRSGHGNAYFTGFGKNKRIVFYDTLAESLSGEEMEAVLAHELGHFKKKHIQKHLVLTMALTLVGFYTLGVMVQAPWFFEPFSIVNTSNAVALLLFMLVIPVFTQFLSPLMAVLSRRHEFEADDFAIANAGAEPMISALVKLYKENANTLTPDRLYSAFHDSHPPAPVRIAHLSAANQR